MRIPMIKLPYKRRVFDLNINPNEWVPSDMQQFYLVDHAGNRLTTENGDRLIGWSSLDALNETAAYYYYELDYDLDSPLVKMEITMDDVDTDKCIRDNIKAFIPLNKDGQLMILSLNSKPSAAIVVHCEVNDVDILPDEYKSYIEMEYYMHQDLAAYKYAWLDKSE